MVTLSLDYLQSDQTRIRAGLRSTVRPAARFATGSPWRNASPTRSRSGRRSRLHTSASRRSTRVFRPARGSPDQRVVPRNETSSARRVTTRTRNHAALGLDRLAYRDVAAQTVHPAPWQRRPSRPPRAAQHLRAGADRQRVALDLEAHPFVAVAIRDHPRIERQADGVDRLEGVGGGVVDLEQPLDALGVEIRLVGRHAEAEPAAIAAEGDAAEADLLAHAAAQIGRRGGVEIRLAHLLVGDQIGEEGRAAFGAQLHLTGGQPAERVLDALDQRLAALAQRARGRRRVVEIEVDLRRGRDAELGVVVDDGRPVLGVLHHALDAVEEVELEGGLGVVAQPAQLARDLGLHLLHGGFRAEVADRLDFRGPEHVLLLELPADKRAHLAAFGDLALVGRAALGERDQRQRAVAALDHHGARAHAAGAEEPRARQDRGLEGDVFQRPGQLDDGDG